MKNMKKIALAAAAAVAFVGAAVNAATFNVSTGAGWTSDFLTKTQAQMDANKVLAPDTVIASLVSLNNAVPEFTGSPAPVSAFVYNAGKPNAAWVDSTTTVSGARWNGYQTATNGNLNTVTNARQNDVGYYLFSTDIAVGANQIVSFAAGGLNGKGFASDNRVVGIFINNVKINFVQNGSANNQAPAGSGVFEQTYGSITGSANTITTGPTVRVTFIVENNNPTGTASGNPAGLLVDGLLTASLAPGIPLPTAVWGGLALMGMVAGQRMRRAN